MSEKEDGKYITGDHKYDTAWQNFRMEHVC